MKDNKEIKHRVNTNSRYPHFKQQQYTVGDEEQFIDAIKDLKELQNQDLVMDELNIFKDITTRDFPSIYKNQEKLNILSTFRYIFYKFKKGIYIRIEQNKIKLFLPLSNANFVNEWADQIQVDYEIFKKVSVLDNRDFNEKSINKFIKTWFCNNCLIRYEYPVNESDTNVSNILDFFTELCENRKLPDIDFFVNKRDFPLLKKNLTEPYDDIWGKDKPLISHKYENYLPILSMSKTDEFNDLLIPTHEDWARCQYQDNRKWFSDSRIEKEDETISDDFHTKIPTAVFRGSSTGNGFTIETNTRLKLAYLSSLEHKQADNVLYLNCGITKWNSRVKKMGHTKKLEVIEPKVLNIKLSDFMPLKTQRQYKYIVHVDGHVSAFRLSAMMKLNCVLLIVDSPWKLWFSDMLLPYEHYIPIKADLSDIYEQIDWCRENDEMCELIAYNALTFADKVLSRDGLFDFTQKLLIDLKNFMNYSTMDIKPIEQSQSIPILPNMEGAIIYENRNVTIQKVHNKNLILKKKKDIHIHQNLIAPKVSNFCEIYGKNEDGWIVMDFVEGVKMYDYLKGEDFKFDVYLDILTQLSYALYEAQTKMLFVHNDLTPWNIILQKLNTPQKVTYCKDKYYCYSEVIPVIIDYDKARYIDDNFVHQGVVNRFRFSSIHDVISLLFTSLYQILTSQTLKKNEIGMILRLGNFISNTEYYPSQFNSIVSLKQYLYSMKKHSALLYTDKKDLEKMNPLDFVDYIKRMRRMKLDKKQMTETRNQYKFDEYELFWSPKRNREIREEMEKENLSELKKKQPKSIDILEKIANIMTVKSLYK